MKYLVFVLSLSLLFSCNKKDQALRNTYKVSKFEIEPGNAKLDTNKLEVFKVKCEQYFKDSFIKLYESDSVTLLTDLGDYSYGKITEFNDNELVFSLKELGSFKFSVQQEKDDADKLEYLVLKGLNQDGFVVKLLLKVDDYWEYPKMDFLSYENNKWRIAPDKNENPGQIKSRVLAQLDYTIKYFEMVNDKKYRIFKIGHLNSPFKFYANGIGINDFTLERYNKIFYDSADSHQALMLLNGGIDSIGVYPSDSSNFTNGYINAIKAIVRFIKIA